MDRIEPRTLTSGGGSRVAVIGSGIAGLASAWLLARQDTVTLFEGASYAGGHTNTVDVTLDGVTHPVDTGFLVFNRQTYPQLCALFEYLGVEIAASEMSFGVSRRAPDIEWAGQSLDAVFAQRRNLLNPRMWRMLADMLRFNRDVTHMARSGSTPDMSLGAYLEERNYGTAFRDWYLLPMAAAIWSCPVRAMLEYPLSTFVSFCLNHGLVQVFGRPQWLTVQGGGREYVRRLLRDLPDVRLNTPVQHVTRDKDGVWLRHGGALERFDRVVFACHSDQALALLGDGASVEERGVLSAVAYEPNRAILHTDTSLMPRRRKVWSAWNYLADGRGDDGVSVTYWLNRLQPLPFSTPLMVSLNPLREPAPSSVLARFDYAHPAFDRAAVRAQQRLPELQGQRQSWFAGAWTGYGFHEDGLRSALEVARSMGVAAPWQSDLQAFKEYA